MKMLKGWFLLKFFSFIGFYGSVNISYVYEWPMPHCLGSQVNLYSCSYLCASLAVCHSVNLWINFLHVSSSELCHGEFLDVRLSVAEMGNPMHVLRVTGRKVCETGQRQLQRESILLWSVFVCQCLCLRDMFFSKSFINKFAVHFFSLFRWYIGWK